MAPLPVHSPAPVTIYRTRIADAQSREQIRKLATRLKPMLWMRDSKRVRQIQQAATAQELLDLAIYARGLGMTPWIDRALEFGDEMVQPIGERLAQVSLEEDAGERRLLYEVLLEALRWQGEAGAAQVHDRFAELDEQGKSLACVVLGVTGDHSSAGQIWDYYQSVRRTENLELAIGGLWGLVDLQDPRVDQALAEWLDGPLPFFELYGFLARAGSTQCAPLLLGRVTGLAEPELEEAMLALVAIAHRIGREALTAAIQQATEPGADLSEYQQLADFVLTQPLNAAEAYFSMFFRGFRPEDLSELPIGEEDSD